jgi:hypothetical protein
LQKLWVKIPIFYVESISSSEKLSWEVGILTTRRQSETDVFRDTFYLFLTTKILPQYFEPHSLIAEGKHVSFVFLSKDEWNSYVHIGDLIWQVHIQICNEAMQSDNLYSKSAVCQTLYISYHVSDKFKTHSSVILIKNEDVYLMIGKMLACCNCSINSFVKW